MAKMRKDNRLKRFRGWSDDHKERFLGSIGKSLEDFQAAHVSKQRAMIDLARSRQLEKKSDRQQRNEQRNDPAAFTAPLNERMARTLAKREANLRYGGVQGQIRQDQQRVDPWFDQYRQQVTAAQNTFGQQMAPVISGAQQTAQQAGAVAPGIDPNSPEGRQAALAAQSRQALGNLGAQTLQGIQGANQGYFAAQAGPVAGAAQLGLRKELAEEMRGVKREKGEYRASRLGELREDERRNQLERAAFGLEEAEAALDAENDLRDDRAAAREDRRAAAQDRAARRRENREPNKYGYPAKEWRNMTTAQRQAVIREFEEDEKAGGDGKPRFTVKEKRDTRATIRAGISLLREKHNGSPNFWKTAYHELIEEDYDPVIAQAIVQMARGNVGSKTRQRLMREYGVRPWKVKGFRQPDPYHLPGRPPTAPGDRPLTSP